MTALTDAQIDAYIERISDPEARALAQMNTAIKRQEYRETMDASFVAAGQKSLSNKISLLQMLGRG
jgi:hypothetical protein